MSKLTDIFLSFVITRSLGGFGPAFVGLLFALSIPAALMLMLVSTLYPCGVAGFAREIARTILCGLH